MSRKIIIREWATSILAYVMIFPFIMVWDFLASPFRLWATARELTREKLAEIEMRGVLIQALTKAAQDAHAEMDQKRRELVN